MRLYTIMFLTLFLAMPFTVPSCNPQPVMQKINETINPEPVKTTMTIASWNLQIFGDSKVANTEVLDEIVNTIQKYDIMAIQEIRDEDQSSIPILMNKLSSYGISYSERLGRTTSKEQYAFVYNKNTTTPGVAYTYNDVKDFFEREPYMQQFTTGSFSYVLIDVHIKPDDALNEINHLDNVLAEAKSHYPNEDDFIVLGDMNADCSYFPDGTQTDMRGVQYKWIVDDWEDTTTRNTQCAYDRFILLKEPLSSDYTGRYGIEPMSDLVSDHKPIWAEFRI
jgi:deoxyribonuclease-1-like protein